VSKERHQRKLFSHAEFLYLYRDVAVGLGSTIYSNYTPIIQRFGFWDDLCE